MGILSSGGSNMLHLRRFKRFYIKITPLDATIMSTKSDVTHICEAHSPSKRTAALESLESLKKIHHYDLNHILNQYLCLLMYLGVTLKYINK